MKIGYARVSTADQSLSAQLDMLHAAGCERIYEEVASGARQDRPKLSELMSALRKGDTLVVTKMDRVARSLTHLITLAADLKQRGIEFQSLSEAIDTSTPGGTLVFHILGAIGEFERDLIRERTSAGLKAARQRGRVGGRPRKMTQEKIQAAKELLKSGVPVKDVADTFGISVPTLFRYCPATER